MVLRRLSRGLGLWAVASCALSLVACSAGGSGDPGYKGGGGASSGGGGGDVAPPEVSADATWNDGLQITNPVVIDEQSTVTIAPGATIHVGQGIQITVKGTLKGASASGKHALITGDANQFLAIVVAPGGTLQFDGVDITNAVAAIDVQGGSLAASYDDGTITAAKQPFAVEAGAKLTSSHAVVTGSLDTAIVEGEFHAQHLDYDSNGHDGITAQSDQAIVDVTDSTMHGNAGTTDMFVSYSGAGTVHVAYTDIKSVHCAFHFERITNLQVDHVTATGDYDGFMLYGSLDTGTRTITASNLEGLSHAGIEEFEGAINGVFSFDGVYFANDPQNTLLQAGTQISVTNVATSEIADAHPRAN